MRKIITIISILILSVSILLPGALAGGPGRHGKEKYQKYGHYRHDSRRHYRHKRPHHYERSWRYGAHRHGHRRSHVHHGPVYDYFRLLHAYGAFVHIDPDDRHRPPGRHRDRHYKGPRH